MVVITHLVKYSTNRSVLLSLHLFQLAILFNKRFMFQMKFTQMIGTHGRLQMLEFLALELNLQFGKSLATQQSKSLMSTSIILTAGPLLRVMRKTTLIRALLTLEILTLLIIQPMIHMQKSRLITKAKCLRWNLSVLDPPTILTSIIRACSPIILLLTIQILLI